MYSLLLLLLAATSPVVSGVEHIDGRTVHVVIAKLNAVRVQVALGGSHVGDTAFLGDIARRYHAVAAINGGYFEAYRPERRKNLIHTLMIDGSLVFKGDVGSVLFFDRNNHAWIERVPMRIAGSLDGRNAYPNDWYAYWLNRLPGPDADTITIFTPAWGTSTGLPGGPQIQVTNGVVSGIAFASMPIPANGYVIYFRGEQRVASHFWIGREASYTVTTPDGSPLGDFAYAWQALGGGPQLLTEGHVFANPAAEGFHDPKLYGDGLRSMVGVTRDQQTLIMAVADCTLVECANIMLKLGAYDAMNLDGGASSALWANGSYVVSPGRPINNALLLTR